MSPDLFTDNYDYCLPKELIATAPVYPRDHAKLLVYKRDTDTITHTTFKHLLSFIPKECAVFLNDTRVIKARIFGKKLLQKNNKNTLPQEGGKIELLLNKPLENNLYSVMIRGKVRIGTRILFAENLVATVKTLLDDGSRIVSFLHKGKILCFDELVLILDTIGHLPLPPYMQRKNTQKDEQDYQTLFAKNAGAVAAPTASLHFTPRLLKMLKKKYNTYTLTLHIGAGTFKPVDTDHILKHSMHSEYFHIPKTSAKILKSDKPLLAIGTTVTRTIEYYARTKQTQGECDLFLNPSNPPSRVTHLLTNFHLPKSTLIMLVSSFIGREKTLYLYQEAIKKRYRFFSYGDAMLIL